MKFSVGHDGGSGPIILCSDAMYGIVKWEKAGWEHNFEKDEEFHRFVVEALNAYKPRQACLRETPCSHGAEWNCICECHGPLPKMLYDVMLELEKLPASEQQTKVVVMLSAVGNKVRELLYENSLNVLLEASQSDLV